MAAVECSGPCFCFCYLDGREGLGLLRKGGIGGVEGSLWAVSCCWVMSTLQVGLSRDRGAVGGVSDCGLNERQRWRNALLQRVCSCQRAAAHTYKIGKASGWGLHCSTPHPLLRATTNLVTRLLPHRIQHFVGRKRPLLLARSLPIHPPTLILWGLLQPSTFTPTLSLVRLDAPL